MTKFKNSMSIGGLANHLGIPRQRIYNRVRKRQFPQPHQSEKGLYFDPAQLDLITDAVVRVKTAGRDRIVFDFV